jgi:hypothetical protein
MSDFAPFTGFGDDPSTSIKFTVVRPDGVLPDWSGGPGLRQKTIPGSTRVNIRRMGRQPYTVSFRLLFDTTAAFEAMDAAQGDVATLRYAWGITKTVGGHHEQILHRGYLAIPGVRLLQLVDEQIEPDGQCEATATFLKPAGGSV